MVEPKRAPLLRDVLGGFFLGAMNSHRADQQNFFGGEKDRSRPVCHGTKVLRGGGALPYCPALLPILATRAPTEGCGICGGLAMQVLRLRPSGFAQDDKKWGSG